MFHNTPFDDLKAYYDNELNKDKTTFKTSNDEPTPIGCIEEMLSCLPDSLWTHDLKVLDPCCGNGNFGLVISNKLGRTNIHFNDINQSRLDNVKKVFRDAIITQKDFLTEEFDQDYDLVVGNPPYALIMENGKRASKNHSIFGLFIKKSLDCLKTGGYLVYIVPDNWMSLADRNSLCETLTGYQFVKLSIHTSKKWFSKVGSSFTWFAIQKVPGTSPFQIEYLHRKLIHTSTINSQVREYIPLWFSREIQTIFAKTVDSALPKYKVETSSNLHKYTKKTEISEVQSPEFCWRLIHTPSKTVWAKRAHKFQDGWKVFISTTDKYSVFVDNCGMTQSVAFIRCSTEKEARDIAENLGHPLYHFLNNACRYGNFNNIRVMQKFPISTGNVYTGFGITEAEIRCIESHL
jgi:SAM-dependent methyltransferase